MHETCGSLSLASIIVTSCVLQRYDKDDVIFFDEDPNILLKISYVHPEQGSGGTIVSNCINESRRNSFNIDDCSHGVHGRVRRLCY